MSELDLSPDELLDAAAPRGKLFTIYQRDQCRRVADKAVEKVLRVLSEQCGGDPCVGCAVECYVPYQKKWVASKTAACGPLAFHLGTLAQAAKDEQLLQARERIDAREDRPDSAMDGVAEGLEAVTDLRPICLD